jgi:hypothetical protein
LPNSLDSAVDELTNKMVTPTHAIVHHVGGKSFASWFVRIALLPPGGHSCERYLHTSRARATA